MGRERKEGEEEEEEERVRVGTGCYSLTWFHSGTCVIVLIKSEWPLYVIKG